jgi:hypothetical protein
MFLPDNQPNPPRKRPARPGDTLRGRILVDFEGRSLCGRCGEPICEHARDNDGSPACDSEISNLKSQIPLVRTGQGDSARSDDPNLFDFATLVLIGVATLIVAALIALAANFLP